MTNELATNKPLKYPLNINVLSTQSAGQADNNGEIPLVIILVSMGVGIPSKVQPGHSRSFSISRRSQIIVNHC